jgi:hypothetical protein
MLATVSIRRTRHIATNNSGYVVRLPGSPVVVDISGPDGGEAAIRAAVLELGCPPDVAELAANRTACGDWTSHRYQEAGDPELCVRF